ncbi:MAG TPA: BON domain-containing protein [Pyrinomonadaceae bacterium]|jgi:hyperosmotically inducible protein
MQIIKSKLVAFAAALALVAGAALCAPTHADAQGLAYQQLSKQVRKELVTLPYYGVFDNLAYEINGGTVTLYGQVVQPSTRSDAARRVARLAGVNQVVNRIEVLPLSPYDDSIRRATYRSVFNTAGLWRYAMGGNPSLHIIVNGGRVTLEGVVANNADRQWAYMAASRVPGVFAVTNNLRTDREARER